LFLEWVVTLLTLLYRITFLPHIFAILVIMVAFSAGEPIIVMVFFVAEIDGTLFVSLVPSILDANGLRTLVSSTEHAHSQEKQTSK